ncbi:hypothetical protein GGR57DRAFT_76443 [Xylariaceae sp. FL1272]|nr:hypothetical protein GGR57DRAFT_76443 [Xylariaceae sp. FL1272]
MQTFECIRLPAGSRSAIPLLTSTRHGATNGLGIHWILVILHFSCDASSPESDWLLLHCHQPSLFRQVIIVVGFWVHYKNVASALSLHVYTRGSNLLDLPSLSKTTSATVETRKTPPDTHLSGLIAAPTLVCQDLPLCRRHRTLRKSPCYVRYSRCDAVVSFEDRESHVSPQRQESCNTLRLPNLLLAFCFSKYRYSQHTRHGVTLIDTRSEYLAVVCIAGSGLI